MKFNKRVYLCCIWSITLLVIIFTCIKTVKTIKNNFMDDDTEVLDSELSYSQTLESFTNINVRANILNLTIRPGDEYKVQAYFSRPELRTKYEVKDSTLYITQNNPKAKNSKYCNLEITIPETAVMESSYININVGEISISDFKSNTIDFETNVGEVRIKRADFQKITGKTNVGEITLTPTASISDYNIEAKADIGNISVDHQSYKRSCNKTVNSNKSINLKTNVGAINIK